MLFIFGLFVESLKIVNVFDFKFLDLVCHLLF